METNRKIIRNMARCKKCGDTIESKHRHDYVSCHCGRIAVDGGRAYIRRAWPDGNPDDFIDELSQFEEEIHGQESQGV